jgi:TrmH family RNA methyltransferase
MHDWAIEALLVICEGHEHNDEIQALLSLTTPLRPILALDAALCSKPSSKAPSSSGIIALSAIPYIEPASSPRQGSVCLLENLQDPGNVGTILRTAAAAGVDQVWLSSGCADVWSPKVLRAGMGAHFASQPCGSALICNRRT